MSEKETRKFDPKQYYGHPLFYKIVEELKQLHSKKNFQYASKGKPLGNFERVGRLAEKLLKEHVPKPLGAAMFLMGKQIDAVYEMVGEGKIGTEEELEDKFKDIAVYSIICMILIKENKVEMSIPIPISPEMKLTIEKELKKMLGSDKTTFPSLIDFLNEVELRRKT